MEPPLAIVRAVLDHDDRLAGCPHVADFVSQFLDTSAAWTVERAACAGHLSLLKRLGRRDADIAPRQLDWAMRTAADRGALEIVQWLSAYRPDAAVSTRVMDSAALRGHLHVVQWLHRFRDEGCTTHAMDSAAACGRLDVVQWLHANRSEGCTTAAMDSAAAGGHLKVVQWLAAHRGEGCTTVAVNFAMLNGHVHVLKWLSEQQRGGRRLFPIPADDEAVEADDNGQDNGGEAADGEQPAQQDEQEQQEEPAVIETLWLAPTRRERRGSATMLEPPARRHMRRFH